MFLSKRRILKGFPLCHAAPGQVREGITMTRYYFHIRDRYTFIRDEDGMELRDIAAARAEARLTGAQWLATDSRGGMVEITDRDDVLLDALPMRGTLH
jgi:hypothetical protein